MASAGAVRVSEREALRHATMTITIVNPIHHRILRWMGMKLLALGSVLLGVGEVVINEEER